MPYICLRFMYRVTLYFVRFVPSFCSDDFICKTFCIPNSNLAHLRTLLNASVRFYFFEKLDFFTNAKLANEGHKFLGPMILLPTNKVGTFYQAIFLNLYTFRNKYSNFHSWNEEKFCSNIDDFLLHHHHNSCYSLQMK